MVNTASVMNDRLWELEVDVNLVSAFVFMFVKNVVFCFLNCFFIPIKQVFVTPLRLLRRNANFTQLKNVS